jgi:NAD(P)-dependent dehydrogenase (short-subunit alcohol dehydrogenase family)
MPSLDGKVSLVTGGTSGIGLAAANALAREGSHVYITGRQERELATAVQQIGSNVTSVQGDVSNAQDLDRLFAQFRGEKGKLDILFANAGIAKYAALGNITEELYDSIFNVNVKGVLSTVQKDADKPRIAGTIATLAACSKQILKTVFVTVLKRSL